MNTIKQMIWLVALTTVFAGCSKQFLELTPPSQVPAEEAITDESSMTTALNGVYQSLRAVDFFGRSIPIDGDLMADNIYIDPIQNSNRYIQEFTYTCLPTNGDVQAMWSSAYNAILRANNVINAHIPNSPQVDQLKGQALMIRALCYFELVKFFATPYTKGPTAAGVPVVLTYDAFAKPARDSVGTVYAQMEADLTRAASLMSGDATNSSYAGKYAAEALLARLYQFKGDWNNALAMAKDVVDNGGYALTPYGSLVNYWSNPFPVTDKVETIFEVEFDDVGNNGTDNLSNFFDQAGYGDALCTDDLNNLYSATDERSRLIITVSRAGRPVLAVNKYPNTSNPNGKDNTKVIRYAEVLLILAEAYYRTGDEPSALNVLNGLAQTRDRLFAGYASTGTALLDNIYLERRKELAFEGHRYWDLVRLNKNVVRNNSTGNYASFVPLTLAANSPKRIFPIPQAELNANKNMSQNTGY